MLMKYISNKKNAGRKIAGMSLVEVIVGAAIIGTAMVTIVGVFGGLSKLSYRNTARIQAAMLSEEGIEAIKTMRDAGWSAKISPLNTSGNTVYRLYWTGTAWTSTTTSSKIDNTFERTFMVYTVERDASFNVVSSGGTTDTNSRKVVVTVSWQDDGAIVTKSLEDYIFNTFNN